MFNFIGENNSNEMGDTCKNQVSIQCLLVLGSASCKTEIIFDVINISFNSRPDFVGVYSILRFRGLFQDKHEDPFPDRYRSCAHTGKQYKDFHSSKVCDIFQLYYAVSI